MNDCRGRVRQLEHLLYLGNIYVRSAPYYPLFNAGEFQPEMLVAFIQA
ncbi:hypothetical protein [Tychonema sp. LEGE 07203]|nr:hypothetical protein [Tychonema sp. LEGE 07203]MBE9095498.1 hypothetical protein [Tychonema sp. LEGE 07203]